jgi:hypothetical protein
MFVCDEIVFLQLQKTAGTHIAALLARHLGGRQHGKHGALDIDPAGRLVVGSVRNPWDWYVSLWAYGCGTRGGVQGLLKGSRGDTALRILGAAWRWPGRWPGAAGDLWRHRHRDPDFWRACYADSGDPEAFRRWLRAILSPEGRRLLGADYAARPLAGCAGFYTYRFLQVFTPAAVWRREAGTIRQPGDIADFVARHGAVQAFVRTERLEEDLAAVFARIGRPDIDAATLRGTRTNASDRQPAGVYYDAETLALVAAADPFVTAHFGYAPPVLAGAPAGAPAGAETATAPAGAETATAAAGKAASG